MGRTQDLEHYRNLIAKGEISRQELKNVLLTAIESQSSYLDMLDDWGIIDSTWFSCIEREARFMTDVAAHFSNPANSLPPVQKIDSKISEEKA